MKVKIITTIWADIDIPPPEAINSDTIGDYKAELDSVLHNNSLDVISVDVPYEEIRIDSVEPYDDGVEKYGDILNKWQPEYERRMNEITKT